MGAWSVFMDTVHEVVPMGQQPELLRNLSGGNFTLSNMYEQFQDTLKLGPNFGQGIYPTICLILFYFCDKYVLFVLAFCEVIWIFV